MRLNKCRWVSLSGSIIFCVLSSLSVFHGSTAKLPPESSIFPYSYGFIYFLLYQSKMISANALSVIGPEELTRAAQVFSTFKTLRLRMSPEETEQQIDQLFELDNKE